MLTTSNMILRNQINSRYNVASRSLFLHIAVIKIIDFPSIYISMKFNLFSCRLPPKLSPIWLFAAVSASLSSLILLLPVHNHIIRLLEKSLVHCCALANIDKNEDFQFFTELSFSPPSQPFFLRSWKKTTSSRHRKFSENTQPREIEDWREDERTLSNVKILLVKAFSFDFLLSSAVFDNQ